MTRTALAAVAFLVGCGARLEAQPPIAAPPSAPPPPPAPVAPAPTAATSPGDGSLQALQARFAEWCALDRAERMAAREVGNANARKLLEQMRVDSEKAAITQKRDADAAASRASYIKKNCHLVGRPQAGPTTCVDEAGFLRECNQGLDVYMQCPMDGPNGLRGIIGGPATQADRSRVARAATSPAEPPATAAAAPNKDESCRALDEAAR